MARKPIVNGTRISVDQVLGHLAGGRTKAELIENYPTLKDEDISAWLVYGHDVVAGEDVMLSVA